MDRRTPSTTTTLRDEAMGGSTVFWSLGRIDASMETRTTPDSSSESPIVHDLSHLASTANGRKPAWSYQGEEMNLNLISCTAGQSIGRHVTTEVEVVLIGVDGDGSVEVNGHWHMLGSGQLVVIAKGVQRAIRCNGQHFSYLTCHRSRPGLMPKIRPDGDAITRGALL